MNQGVICCSAPYEGKTWGDVEKIVVKEKGEAVWMSWPQSVRWRARTENDDLKEEIKRLKDEIIDLKFIPEVKHPKNVTEYKALFKTLNINYDGIKGLRAFKQAYIAHLEEDVKTEELSEMDLEGVTYLEDEETGKIYNMERHHVGKWTEDVDDCEACYDIIWVNDKYRNQHNRKRK